MSTKYAGADWIRKTRPDANMSVFGELVADVIGQVTRGIYHVAGETKSIDWNSDHFIEWRTRRNLATFDGLDLTALVVLAHDQCVRVEISAMSNTTVAICFSPRSGRSGSTYSRHPTLEENVEQIRDALGLPVEGLG